VKHVFVVLLENENAGETFGPDSKAPFLTQELTRRGQFLPNYYGIGHLSLDNYIALISGQAPNAETQADCTRYSEFLPPVQMGSTSPVGQVFPPDQAVGQGCVYPRSVPTVANQLDESGLSWRGYMEDMGNNPARDGGTTCAHPPVGSLDMTQQAQRGDQYATRHNPFVYFHSIIDFPTCGLNDVPLTRLREDLASSASTPSYSFITPNLCNDGHDTPCVDGRPGGLETANEWLKDNIPPILDSPAYKDGGMLVVTFDEAEANGPAGDSSACCGEKPGPNSPNPGGPTPGPGGGRIGAVVVSPFVKPGTVNKTDYNHYAFLRTVEDLFGLQRLGYAGQTGLKAFGDDVFNASTDAGGGAGSSSQDGTGSSSSSSEPGVPVAVGPRSPGCVPTALPRGRSRRLPRGTVLESPRVDRSGRRPLITVRVRHAARLVVRTGRRGHRTLQRSRRVEACRTYHVRLPRGHGRVELAAGARRAIERRVIAF